MTMEIINADATDEEIAAIVIAIASLGADAAPPTSRRTSEWAAPVHSVRRQLRPGPGAWRSSMLGR